MVDPAVANIHRFGTQPFCVFVDHASNVVPNGFNDLGLEREDLQKHIAWDIGAEALGIELGRRLQAPTITCAFSRLFVDVNRHVDSTDLIPSISDGIEVPANIAMDSAEKQKRLEQFYFPYHQCLAEEIEQTKSLCSDAFVVSVHSFTNQLETAEVARPWHAGLLWNDDENSARAALKWFAQNTEWQVGDNEPYDARAFNHSVDTHVGPRGLRHLTFEVRQDILSSAQGILDSANILEALIRHVASGGGVN